MRKGISLVALIITIIVLIILTAAVVLTGVGTPQEAQLAVFYNNVSTVQEAVRLQMNSNLTKYASKGTTNLMKYKWVNVVNEYEESIAQNGINPVFNDAVIQGINVAKIDKNIKKNMTISDEEFNKYYVAKDGTVYYEGFLYNGVTYYTNLVTSETQVPTSIESNVTLNSINITSPVSGTYGADEVITIEVTFGNDVFGTRDGNVITSVSAPVISMRIGTGTPRNATFSSINGNKIIYTLTSRVGDNGRVALNNCAGTVYDQNGDYITISPVTMGGNNIIIETTVWSTAYDIDWYTGNPDVTDFYIYTADELAGWSYLSSEGVTFEEKTIHIMDNIVLNTGTFSESAGYFYYTPIGASAIRIDNLTSDEINFWIPITSFAGTLNGHSHTVSGLFVYQDTTAGLILNCTNTSKIEDFGVINSCVYAIIVDSDYSVAGLITVNSSGIINKCYTSSSYLYAWKAGGICYYGKYIYNCYNTSTIGTSVYSTSYSTQCDFGGISVYALETANCYNKGKITGYRTVGGIVGVPGYSNPDIVRNTYNTGVLSSTYKGYFVGYKFYYGNSAYGYGLAYNWYGGSEGSHSASNYSNFSGSGTTWTLNTAVAPNGTSTRDLLTALNDYVTAHRNEFEVPLEDWYEDINNINDGYPILSWQENR